MQRVSRTKLSQHQYAIQTKPDEKFSAVGRCASLLVLSFFKFNFKKTLTWTEPTLNEIRHLLSWLRFFAYFAVLNTSKRVHLLPFTYFLSPSRLFFSMRSFGFLLRIVSGWVLHLVWLFSFVFSLGPFWTSYICVLFTSFSLSFEDWVGLNSI